MIHFNGIDALTGDYLQQPISEEELASRILGLRRRLDEERDLKWWHQRYQDRGVDRRPAPEVNPMDLSSSGWGVIFAKTTPPEVRDALRPLLEHRRAAAAKNKETYYREIECLPGESKDQFFRRLKEDLKIVVEPGPAHPDQFPYYLLIVGDPETVPPQFQYLLDLQYAVGRLYFDDPEDYGRYAQSVILAERGQSRVLPEAVFFGVHHESDEAMRRANERLIEPLLKRLTRGHDEWKIRRSQRADKAELTRLLGGGATPALLFTAAHGLTFPNGHPLQSVFQGALLCEDGEGPGHGPAEGNRRFGAKDVSDDARLHGLIAFLFGCYSAGTPRIDNFPPEGWDSPIERAPRAFLAPLAKRLLSHPKGSALAVVGHLDRAWSSSFGSAGGMGYSHIEALLKYLLDGWPVGLAMDWMNERFAELSAQLTDMLDEYKPGEADDSSDEPRHVTLARLWRAHHDARNFVVLGDPAVYLAAGPRPVRSGMMLPVERSGAVRLYRRHSRLNDVLARLADREPFEPIVSTADAVRAEREQREI